ncbi:MAG TPA: class II aldolase/adducin family protein, partial [Microthrixaceae bacterium]|nr:class II aldolase/adducin family protein [Microthrixaceae bacterium]
VDADANVIHGKWDVTPAIHIHTELHRVRPDARVVVHNHPYHVSVLAALGELPRIVHQTGAMFEGDLKLVEEYTGEIDNADLGAELAERIGDSSVVILASHGIIVTAPTVEEAVYRSASIDRVARMTLDIMRLGRESRRLPDSTVAGMKVSLIERGSAVYFAGAVRQLIQSDPGVLL